MITVTRHHDISAGHRVVGHEGACSRLHGHNYRIHFTCSAANLDQVGRVIDFSQIKNLLCQWLEDNWDHKMLLWQDDPWWPKISAVDESVVVLPFNPTAENLASYLVNVIAPTLFNGTDVKLTSCVIDETRKCSATVALE